MLPAPVAYLVHREAKSAPVLLNGKAYAYVIAGNGLFKLASGRHLEALIPVAHCPVVGLPPLMPYARLRRGRIPGQLLQAILKDARAQAWDSPREAMYHLAIDDRQKIHLSKPGQRAGAAHLGYTGGHDQGIVCDVHSHHEMRAFFSPTDDGDELGFRFYAVVGRIFTQPEIRLRVGVYGSYWTVPVAVLFTGVDPFTEIRD